MTTVKQQLEAIVKSLLQIKQQTGKQFVSRFAPSPTGYLHLGHVASAMFVYIITRAVHGKLILRIEDHDKTRCRPSFEAECLKDLEWLGFTYENGVRELDQRSSFRQSDNHDHYLAALSKLQKNHLVYGCDCSRKSISAASPLSGTNDETRYDGKCRHLNKPLVGNCLRVEIADQDVPFDDLWLGAQRQNPQQQCGDLLLQDRHGHFTYQYAVSLDDFTQEVNLVIRGCDLLSSTGRQIMLANMLGRTEPAYFLHHPLITDTTGKKLSKRDAATGIRNQRLNGVSAAQIIGEVALLTGIITSPAQLSLDELTDLIIP